MTEGDEWLMGLLKETQLESFHSQLTHQLQITRPSHFEYVQTDDLEGIGMSRPSSRRLLEAFKKLHGKKSLFNKIFTSSKPPLPQTSPTHNHGDPRSDDVKCLINLNDLHFVSTLGSGSFGVVRKAIWMTSLVNKIAVAVKVLRSSEGWEFVREVNLMHSIHHPHLITLHGVVLDNPPLMVTELAPLGSLLGYLRSHSLLITTIHSFLHQICLGMLYLESRSLIHRDLAARNILLSSPTIVKIGDFGLTRSLNDEDVYVTDEKQRMPFAWCAPESMHSRVFSHKSDVWMVGVVAWELYAGGRDPWMGLNGAQVLAELEKGNRLEKASLCSARVYEGLMCRCWQQQASLRPSFKQLLDILAQLTPRDLVVKVEGEGEVAAYLIEAGRDTWRVQLKSTAEVTEVVCADVINNNNNNKNKRLEISEPLRDTFKHTGHSDGVGQVWGDPGSIDGAILDRRATAPDILPISSQQGKQKIKGRGSQKKFSKHTSMQASKSISNHPSSHPSNEPSSHPPNHPSSHLSRNTPNPTSKRTPRPPLNNPPSYPSNRPLTQPSLHKTTHPTTNKPTHPYSPKRTHSPTYSSTYQSIHSISPPTSPSTLSHNPLNDGYLFPEETKVILRTKKMVALALFDSSIEPSTPLAPPTNPIPPLIPSPKNPIPQLIPPHPNQISKSISDHNFQSPISPQSSIKSTSDSSVVDYSKLSDLFNDVNLNSPSILTPEIFPQFHPKTSPPILTPTKSPPFHHKPGLLPSQPYNSTNLKRNPSKKPLLKNNLKTPQSTSPTIHPSPKVPKNLQTNSPTQKPPSNLTQRPSNNLTQKPKIICPQNSTTNLTNKPATKKTVLLPSNRSKLSEGEDVYCNHSEISHSSRHSNHSNHHNGDTKNHHRIENNGNHRNESIGGHSNQKNVSSHRNQNNGDHSNDVYANHEDFVNQKSNKKVLSNHPSSRPFTNQQSQLSTSPSTHPSSHPSTHPSIHTSTSSSHSPPSSSHPKKRSKKEKERMVDELVEMGVVGEMGVVWEMGVVDRRQASKALLTSAFNTTEALKILKEDRLHSMGLVSLQRCKSILQDHNYDLSAALHSITHSSSV